LILENEIQSEAMVSRILKGERDIERHLEFKSVCCK